MAYAFMMLDADAAAAGYFDIDMIFRLLLLMPLLDITFRCHAATPLLMMSPPHYAITPPPCCLLRRYYLPPLCCFQLLSPPMLRLMLIRRWLMPLRRHAMPC